MPSSLRVKVSEEASVALVRSSFLRSLMRIGKVRMNKQKLEKSIRVRGLDIFSGIDQQASAGFVRPKGQYPINDVIPFSTRLLASFLQRRPKLIRMNGGFPECLSRVIIRALVIGVVVLSIPIVVRGTSLDISSFSLKPLQYRNIIEDEFEQGFW